MNRRTRGAIVALGLALASGVVLAGAADRPSVSVAAGVLMRYDCHEASRGVLTAETKRLQFGCHSNIPDAAFAHLAAFPKLEQLDFISNELTDAGLATLRRLPELRVLCVNGSKITDAGIEVVKDLPRLTELTLMRTQLTATGLARLHEARNLKTLVLVRLRKTPELLEELKTFRHLERLILTQTALSPDESRVLSAALPNLEIAKN